MVRNKWILRRFSNNDRIEEESKKSVGGHNMLNWRNKLLRFRHTVFKIRPPVRSLLMLYHINAWRLYVILFNYFPIFNVKPDLGLNQMINACERSRYESKTFTIIRSIQWPLFLPNEYRVQTCVLAMIYCKNAITFRKVRTFSLRLKHSHSKGIATHLNSTPYCSSCSSCSSRYNNLEF